MNTKALETLDYRPTSAPPEAKEDSTPIIEPETGEEKQEVASQHLEPIKTGCAVKSRDLIWVDIIGRYTKLINTTLEQLPKELTAQAFEDIDLFQKTTLFELRRACE